MKHFKTTELVSKELYTMLGERSIKLFDKSVLDSLDNLRERWGSFIRINDWSKGGPYNQSGLRELNSKVGAVKSKHKEAIAFDVKTQNIKKFYEFVTTTPGLNIIRVEDINFTPSWVHIEFGENKGLPKIFKP